MNLLWLAVVFFSGWWLDALGFVGAPSQGRWLWLACGVLAALAARGREVSSAPHRFGLVVACAAGIAAAVFGPVLGVGPLLMIGAAVLALVLGERARFRFVANGIAEAGFVLACQTLGVLAFWWIAPRVHALPELAAPCAAVLRMFGLRAGASDGIVDVVLQEDDFRFTVGAEHLGLFPALLIASGALPLLWFHRPRFLGSFARVAGLLAAYCALRYLAVIVTFRMQGDGRVFWMTMTTVLTFVPFAALAAWIVPLAELRAGPLPDREAAPRKPVLARALASAIAAAFLLAAAFTFHDPGRAKSGSILLDEGHSDWEWSDEPLDTRTYGMRSTYNYYNFADFLARHWKLERNLEPLTPERLAAHDVLIVKTPTIPFAHDEVKAIEEFVAAGGGLWLIGDHTNVFGTATYLNPIAELFGMRFRADCQYDLGTGALSVYRTPVRGSHPVVANLPTFLFATSCTLGLWIGAESVITGTGISVLPADYSQQNFFPRNEPRRDMQFGLFSQAGAATHGAGRVLAFTDSTVFSNFFMYIPGKPELALGSVEWLMRTNRFGWVREVAGWSGLLLLVASLLSMRSFTRPWSAAVLACGVAVGASFACLATDAITAATSELPAAREPSRVVYFDLEHSNIFLPIVRLQGNGDDDYSTFFTWVQRLGMQPCASARLENTWKPGGLVVIADPVRPLERDELARTEAFVRDGGALLVLVRADNPRKVVEPLLGAFDMALGEPVEKDRRLEVPFELLEPHGGIRVSGGEPLLATKDGDVLAVWARHGRGRVVACGLAELFEAKQMGTTGSKPTVPQFAIFDLEYALVRLCAGDIQPPLDRLTLSTGGGTAPK